MNATVKIDAARVEVLLVRNLTRVWAFHGGWEQITKEANMARDEHNKAAEHHENAAKAHRSAAEHHGKGDHAKGGMLRSNIRRPLTNIQIRPAPRASSKSRQGPATSRAFSLLVDPNRVRLGPPA
jgi:hypothetical protein